MEMIRSLIYKEIRLQQNNLDFAILLVSVWMLAFLFCLYFPKAVFTLCFYHNIVIIPACLIFLPVSFGAAAFSMERANRVIYRQLSFPASRRIQWLVKVGVCVLLSLILILGIFILFDAMLVGYFKESIRDIFGHTSDAYGHSPLRFQADFWPGIYVLLFAALGFYLSSISNDPLTALTRCIGVFLLSWLGTGLIRDHYSIMDMFNRTIGSYFGVIQYPKPYLHVAERFYLRCGLLSFTLFGLAYTNFYPEGLQWCRSAIHAVLWFGLLGILAYYQI